MNALSIAALGGGASHLIPLYVLHRRYFSRMKGWQNFFLLPKDRHENFLREGIDVLPIDYSFSVAKEEKDFSRYAPLLQLKENLALSAARPDIILEDNSFSAPLIAEKNNIPRISIHRTGFFRSLPEGLKNPSHMHSLEKGFEKEKWFDASIFLQAVPGKIPKNQRTDTDLLRHYLFPRTKLIPGIPSIEVLPEDMPDRSSFFYTGPLTVEDRPSPKLQQELSDFFMQNRGRRKVFFTLGLIERSDVQVYLDHLLAKGYAVVSTIKSALPASTTSRYFYNPFLPLHFVCSQVDLIIHQCGSGMYHYPILNEKPAITLGTRCYDREDVALRLQQLGVSRHVPHRQDNADHLTVFQQQLESFEKGMLNNDQQLRSLKEEVYQTMLNFDMEAVLVYTLT
jgi:hypothetical protein